MKKQLQIALVVIGVLSIILAICCFTAETGYSESNERYGGDAYTGIQNAAAQTANNVRELAEIVSFGAGSCLLVGGLTLVAVGVMGQASEKKPELPETGDAVSEAQ